MTLLNQTQFAAQTGLTPGYISQLKAAGRLVLAGKLINLEASLQRIEETSDMSRKGVAERHMRDRMEKHRAAQAAQAGTDSNPEPPLPAAEAAPPAQPDPEFNPGAKAGSVYQHSRAVREKYAAMAAKRDYEISIRTLLLASEVSEIIANAAVIVRTRIESMPDILAPQFAAEKDEQKIRSG